MKLNFLIAAVLMAQPAIAHEFWLEPEEYVLDVNDTLTAAIRVGEEFSGSGYSYNPRNFRRFDYVTGEDVTAIPGRAGDRPAVNMAAEDDGLLTLVHVTNDMHLTYTDPAKFENFLRHKDWLSLLAEHARRGLPEKGFRERYSRYGKSLVAVGSGDGADRPTGLLTEIVALANPYTDELSEMPVRVLYEGQPRSDAQVELFEKTPDGTVKVTLHRTDADGIARLPVTAGNSYLADAVVIRSIEPVEENDPVWESLWASLTFAIP